jgi:predicted MFS family arabinose efflux permease
VTHDNETLSPAARRIIIVAALGYFVDIFDLVLFAVVRTTSLRELGFSGDELTSQGVYLLNAQMLGLLAGGVIWGILGDKRGRLSVLFGSIFLYSLANVANAFVHDVHSYAALRFIGGVGLAGELGGGVTLVLEMMPRKNRGMGAALIAGFGLLGAVAAAIAGELMPWREAYILGGVMGFALLALRIGVRESELFTKAKDSSVVRGDFTALFRTKERAVKFISGIVVGMPTWFTMGVLGVFSPELGRVLGVQGEVKSGTFIMVFYLGAALGDLASGLLSQRLKSRRKAIFVFTLMLGAANVLYFCQSGASLFQFYAVCGVMGFCAGYWVLLVVNAGEQFGTNLRATTTTATPNFIRGSVVPMTLLFEVLRPELGLIYAAAGVGVVVYTLALLALRYLPETFAKDLNYVEHDPR